MTTTHATRTPPDTTLHWGRIVGGAFLLEILLFVVLIPIGLAFGMPGVPGATDFTVFFVAAIVAAFAGGYAAAAWMLRRVMSRRVLHGTLLGVVATLLYLGICSTQPGGVPAVAAGYGAPLFWALNALRVGGCVLGAWRGGRAA